MRHPLVAWKIRVCQLAPVPTSPGLPYALGYYILLLARPAVEAKQTFTYFAEIPFIIHLCPECIEALENDCI